MNPWDRVASYRRRAEEMVQKASQARTPETQRAYQILARDWRKMATALELRFLEAEEASLVPGKQTQPMSINSTPKHGKAVR